MTSKWATSSDPDKYLERFWRRQDYGIAYVRAVHDLTISRMEHHVCNQRSHTIYSNGKSRRPSKHRATTIHRWRTGWGNKRPSPPTTSMLSRRWRRNIVMARSAQISRLLLEKSSKERSNVARSIPLQSMAMCWWWRCIRFEPSSYLQSLRSTFYFHELLLEQTEVLQNINICWARLHHKPYCYLFFKVNYVLFLRVLRLCTFALVLQHISRYLRHIALLHCANLRHVYEI